MLIIQESHGKFLLFDSIALGMKSKWKVSFIFILLFFFILFLNPHQIMLRCFIREIFFKGKHRRLNKLEILHVFIIEATLVTINVLNFPWNFVIAEIKAHATTYVISLHYLPINSRSTGRHKNHLWNVLPGKR